MVVALRIQFSIKVGYSIAGVQDALCATRSGGKEYEQEGAGYPGG